MLGKLHEYANEQYDINQYKRKQGKNRNELIVINKDTKARRLIVHNKMTDDILDLFI